MDNFYFTYTSNCVVLGSLCVNGGSRRSVGLGLVRLWVSGPLALI